MLSRSESFVGPVLLLTFVAALGALRLYADRRFRVRGQLTTNPRLRHAQRVFSAAIVATAAGLLSLMGAASFELSWLARAGAVVGIAGFLVALSAFAVLVRERFRRQSRGGARARSRPAT